MRHAPRLAVACAGLLATSLLTATTWAGGDDDDGFVSNEAIVQLEAGVDIAEVSADWGTTVLDSIDAESLYLLQLPDWWDEEQFELVIEDDDRVDEAELNHLEAAPGGHTQSFFFSEGPEAYWDQYTLARIRLGAAHRVTLGTGAVVALLDTGVDRTHVLLEDAVLLEGVSFVGDGTDDVGNGLDDDGDGFVDELVGHGTFVAGVVHTIAPDAALIPVRVLDGDGRGEAFLVAKGIYWAIEHGATVMNMSLGAPEENEIVEAALARAHEAGIVVIASAGNDGETELTFPAVLETVVAVAATDARDRLADYSNRGEDVHLCAPGTDVVSSVPDDGFGRASGTSFSSALVAGGAALVAASSPMLTPEGVWSALADGAAPIGAFNPEHADAIGAGRLDLGAAVGIPAQPGDIDGDGDVDIIDLMELLGAWGSDHFDADLDHDGVVATADLLVLLGNWG